MGIGFLGQLGGGQCREKWLRSFEQHSPIYKWTSDGERAGFINKDFGLKFMDSLISDPTWATKYSITDLLELTGTQDVELLLWLATRGALGERMRQVHRNHHIPIPNTAAGTMALACR